MYEGRPGALKAGLFLCGGLHARNLGDRGDRGGGVDRFVGLIVAALCLWWSGVAGAETVPATRTVVPKQGSGWYSCPLSGTPATKRDVPYANQACLLEAPETTTIAAAGLYGSSSAACGLGNNARHVCLKVEGGQYIPLAYAEFLPTGTCPPGTVEEDGQCAQYSCPAGWTLEGTMCTRPDQCPPAGTPIPGEVFGLIGVHRSMTFCAAGCEVYAGGGYAISQGSGGSRTEWYGPFSSAGGEVGDCTATPEQAASEPLTPEAECVRRGMTYGTVGGTVVCVAPGEGAPIERARPPSTTETKDGEGTTQQTTEVQRTIECGEGGCVTIVRTIVRDGTGEVVSDTTERVPGISGDTEQGQWCVDNPEAPGCKPSSWGGSCAAGWACEGDAVACALAREVHMRNCQMLSPRSSASTAAAEAYVDGVLAGTGLPENIVAREEFGMPDIVTGERISAGGCPSPTVVNTPMGVITIDVSSYCGLLSGFGWVILAVGIVIGARILLGGL